MPTLLLSILFSVLPERYRKRYLADPDLNVKRGAILSGILESVACALGLWLPYGEYYRVRVEAANAAVLAAGGDKFSEAAASFSRGGLVLFEYMLEPLSVVLFYFFLEGLARIFATVVTGEVLPSMPLQVAAWLHGVGEKKKRERDLGPRIADVVRSGESTEWELRIESCRPKEWTALTTIEYQDQHYELAKELQGAPPRRFVYLLRRPPGGKVIRGLHHYRPEETLETEGD